jgi:hypothetical protein
MHPQRQGQEKRLTRGSDAGTAFDAASPVRFARAARATCEKRRHGMPRKTSPVLKRLLALIAVVVSVSSGAISAQAALVSGILTTPDGHPASDRQIHFENRVTGVLYLVRTDPDGKFSAHLPPGVYDLRQERGPIIRAGIGVIGASGDLGKVPEVDVSFWSHLFELEALGERIANSPAPATANLPGGGVDTQPSAAPSPAVPPR